MSVLTGIITALVIFLVLFIYAFRKYHFVVPFNEVHVVSKKRSVKEYDGKGRYFYFPFLHSRTIIPKHVLDIEPGLMRLHDKDNLPFGVEISIKVQVTDPQKAAATLTSITHNTVAKVVEDTVMSAARSIAMERTIIEIMKKREEIEQDVYNQVSDSLAKLGLSAIIFDIKNIRDVEGKHVIESLERKKIAELEKEARIAEALHESEATQVEVEKRKEAKVKSEQMLLEEQKAELEREQIIAEQNRILELKKLEIHEQKQTRLAEIKRKQEKIEAETEKQKRLAEAQAQAEAVRLKAQAEAEAIKMKNVAEAEGIRERGLAEAEILQKKAEAIEKSHLAGQLKMIEMLAQAQVASAAKMAEALGSNNKIMYLPSSQNILSDFIPKLDAILQSDVLDNLLSKIKVLYNPEEAGSAKGGKKSK